MRARWVAALAQPTMLAGIRLRLEREGKAKLRLCFTEFFESCPGPRELMKIHVASLYNPAVLPEQLQFVFGNQRYVGGPKCGKFVVAGSAENTPGALRN